MMGYTGGVDYRMYQMSFFVGYPIAVTTYIIINKFFPPEGLGIQVELEGPPETVIEGVSGEESISEKEPEVVETKLANSIEDKA